MDLRQLGTFIQVADLGSFTRASHVLHVAQPALSRQVRLLEIELRQTLFERNGRGVTLTEAGKRLLGHARGIVQQVERARQDLESDRGTPAGRLAVALPPSISRALSVALVEAFRERLPRVTLTIVEGLSVYATEWLQQGRVDAAAVYHAGSAPAAGLQIAPVLRQTLYLVSRRDGARSGAGGGSSTGSGRAGGTVPHATLAQLPLVLPSRPHAVRMRLETAMAASDLSPTVALEVESVPAILEIVRRHGFHAVLPATALAGSAHAARFRLQRIGRPALFTELGLATSTQRPGGLLLTQALPLLAQTLRDGLGNAA
jgi:LysR family nitrogen assimilation transcriptional regulator